MSVEEAIKQLQEMPPKAELILLDYQYNRELSPRFINFEQSKEKVFIAR